MKLYQRSTGLSCGFGGGDHPSRIFRLTAIESKHVPADVATIQCGSSYLVNPAVFLSHVRR
jgi:hypothetical protein